jgi:Ribbon-helix-helix protein, copG family
MPSNPAAVTKSPGLKPDKHRFVRLSVNLSAETAEIFKSLIERKGLSISEGMRRAIAVWKFLEDEKALGNEIAVVEPDESVRKVVLL